MSHAVTLLTGWDLAPVPLTGLVLAAVLYVVAARKVTRLVPAQPWPALETGCFLGGIFTTAVAILGPPGAFDDVFFYAHMTQHILLTMVAAPLFVLGDPALLVLRVSSPEFRRRWLVPVYRSRAVGFLVHPVVGWLLFVGVMVLSHVPAVYDFALTRPLVHDFVEHPLYLVTAVVFFYPLLGPTTGPRHLPEGLRVLSLFSVMLPMAMLGFFVYAASHVDYPFYAHVVRPFGPRPLSDQRLSGALMWASSMALSVGWMVLAGLRWLQSEERRSRRGDIAASRVAPPAPESA
ncbi:MAG: cytochrome c oxidase assembly protein [Actinomycetota bacterium]|nr:cytochrome c oxidase assembly protein [Actinomycetota bacterium]